MTACPHDADLPRWAAADLSDAEAAAAERHLDDCPGCRARLEEFARVPELAAALSAAPVPSPGLTAVIDRLSGATGAAAPPFDRGVLPDLPPPATPGTLGRLGGIDIRRVLGRGGMGVVYEGYDPTLERTVAVKVPSPHLLGDPAARDRFLREARALAGFTHENVVAVHAIAEDAGLPYLVLQYVPGESLAAVLARDGKLPADRVTRIAADVARGLAAAHARGLVHRDIKPGNLLVDADTGAVRITDFGLAKAVGGATVSLPSDLAGTPAYMAPEQADGKPVDARADLFSLGVVLYTALAGSNPFDGDSPFVVLDRIRREPAPQLTALDPTIPPDLGDLVRRLLEKDPARRPQSAAAVLELLVHGPRKPPRRRWLAAAVAAAVGLYFAPPFWTTPPVGPTPAPPPFQLLGNPDPFDTLAAAVAAAADGDTVVVSGDGPFPSDAIEIRGKRLTVRAAAGSRPVFQPGTSGPPSVCWILSDSELALHGLDVDWPLNGRSWDNDGGTTDAVIRIKGRLTLAGCRISTGNRISCAACEGHFTATDCLFQADRGGGRGVSWRGPGTVSLTRVAVEARNGVVMSSGAYPPDTAVEIADSVLRGDTGVLISKQPTAVAPVPIAVRRTVFDTEHALIVYYSPTYPLGRRPKAEELRTTARKLVAWSDDATVYRRKMSFLAGWAPQRPQTPADITAAADWLAYWKVPGDTAIDAGLRFKTRPQGQTNTAPVLEAVLDPSGPVPPFAAPAKP